MNVINNESTKMILPMNKKRGQWRYGARITFLLGMFAFCMDAYAAKIPSCHITAGSADLPFNFGTISVPPSLPIGGQIAKYTFSNHNEMICPIAGGYENRIGYTIVPGDESSYHWFFKTPIPGVGVQVTFTQSWYNEDNMGGIVGPVERIVQAYALTNVTHFVYTESVTVELKKIGDVSPGQWMPPSDLAYAKVRVRRTPHTDSLGYTEDSDLYLRARVFSTGPLTIQVPGCELTSQNSLNVSLDNWQSDFFTGLGKTTREEKVPVTLNCGAGARVNAMVAATVDTDNSSAIALTNGAGTATGVGVQILQNNSPITLNQPFIVNDKVNGTGIYELPWTARYIQTAGTVTAGQANASATLTLSYE
ncbi:fimbrial protein [Serratia sp. OS31]|uniref:fimbrial protein n=1 Tax=Serratia sp. OS31 TaxID=2760844 RepID=UPI00160013B9|nr:fimbrial protein [Serratia sp. OS31]MBB1585006.1 fimbrial protein [Serratia sp. OS31]